MVGVQSIGGLPEPANPERVTERPQRGDTAEAAPHDAVSISPEARRAATVARVLTQSPVADEVRAERVAEVRKSIEQGAYRLQEVVLMLAARLSPYVDT